MTLDEVMALSGYQLDAAIAERVFGLEVTWRWCYLPWDPECEEHWENAEHRLDYLAKSDYPRSVTISASLFDDGHYHDIPVTPDWRDYPERYCLQWRPCPDRYDIKGERFWFFPCENYSTDVSDAWKVVDIMQAQHHLHLALNWTGNMWRCSFRATSKFWHGAPPDGSFVWESTAPEAICRAALIADR